MAESRGVSGILGADSEPSAAGSVAETPLDPTAAALAAEAAKSDPELAKKASAYFDKQSHLVEVQTEHLHEQRAVNLSLLKLKRFGDRLRVGLQVFVILVATVIGIFGAVLIHDGLTSRSVVIERFETPHALAERGLTGAVIASGLLDHLTRIQAATRSSTERAKLTNAWERTISIAVPDTGLSIGELSQMLRERFGHDVHISGDLVQTSTDGVALTVRGTGVAPATFSGSLSDLDTLSREAAEYVFGKPRFTFFQHFAHANDGRESSFQGGFQFEVHHVVGLTEKLPAFGMANDRVGAADGKQHGGADFAGISALLFPVQVLRANRHVRSLDGVYGSAKIYVRWADDDLVAIMVRDQGKKVAKEVVGLSRILVHLPVGSD